MSQRVICGSTNQINEIKESISYYTNSGYRVVALTQTQHGYCMYWVCVLEPEEKK